MSCSSFFRAAFEQRAAKEAVMAKDRNKAKAKTEKASLGKEASSSEKPELPPPEYFL
jgi:hypothetical protein